MNNRTQNIGTSWMQKEVRVPQSFFRAVATALAHRKHINSHLTKQTIGRRWKHMK